MTSSCCRNYVRARPGIYLNGPLVSLKKGNGNVRNISTDFPRHLLRVLFVKHRDFSDTGDVQCLLHISTVEVLD
jgi:hypothetical protein